MATDKPTQPKASESLSRGYWTKDLKDAKGMLAELRLSQLVDHDLRLNGNARMVYRFLVGWYIGEYDSALASVRFISDALKLRSPTGKGLSVGSVQASLTLLTSCGWVHRTKKGTGHQASRYVPEWRALEWASAGKLPPIEISVQPSVNATDLDPSVQPCVNSGVQTCLNATGDSVQPSVNEDLLTCTRLQTGLQVGRNNDPHAAPAAPPLAGLAAATAGPARDPEVVDAFDEFWPAYPRKHQRPKALAAWNKLNPTVAEVAIIIAEASALSAHYEKHPVAKKWMPEPANWLAGKRYLEDLPDVYVDPKEAAIAKKRAGKPAKAKPKAKPERKVVRAAAAPNAVKPRPAPSPPKPIVEPELSTEQTAGQIEAELRRDADAEGRRAMVINARKSYQGDYTYLALTFEFQDNRQRAHQQICMVGIDGLDSTFGHIAFKSLCRAMGLPEDIDLNPDEMLFQSVLVVGNRENPRERFKYKPLPTNDNLGQRAAA